MAGHLKPIVKVTFVMDAWLSLCVKGGEDNCTILHIHYDRIFMSCML